MGRRKRKKKGLGSGDETGVGSPPGTSVPAKISQPFADALRGLEPAKPKRGAPAAAKGADPRGGARARAASAEARAPAAPNVSYEDRVAFEQAFAGVRRLDQPSQGEKRIRAQRVAGPVATPHPSDASARARLDALVSGGIRFEVHREEGWVEGARLGADPRALRALQNGRAVADAAVDLHGLRRDDAIGVLRTALRQARGRGHRVVRIIHGKGQHSAGGVGVLGDAVVDAIVDGPLGSLVLAFVTTSLEHGGSGALLVFVAPG